MVRMGHYSPAVDLSNYYTKAEANARFALKTHVHAGGGGSWVPVSSGLVTSYRWV